MAIQYNKARNKVYRLGVKEVEISIKVNNFLGLMGAQKWVKKNPKKKQQCKFEGGREARFMFSTQAFLTPLVFLRIFL